jgi:prevent-host-death family protein
MKSISASEFKARCLTLMEDVRTSGEPLVVTKRGKAVVKLVPAEAEEKEFIGSLKGIVEIVGDLDADSPEVWESAL